ncbi:hypothetical protein Tco_0793632, partial [Tanacetum coccineum]
YTVNLIVFFVDYKLPGALELTMSMAVGVGTILPAHFMA